MRSLSERLWQIVLGPIFGKFYLDLLQKYCPKTEQKEKIIILEY